MGKRFMRFQDHNAKARVKGLLEMGCNGANDNDGDPNLFYGKPRDSRHSKFEIDEIGMTSPEKQVLLILDLLVSLLLL